MLCAIAASVCYGTATVLQAVAARAAVEPGEPGAASGVDAALFLRAVRQWRYLAGLALDGAGFALQIVALRLIPIYAVGAALAASLAVTAVLATRVLAVRLTRTEWTAVALVCLGLAMLGLASGPEGETPAPPWLQWALLVTAVAVLLIGAAAGRLPGRSRALVLGAGAGIGFGVPEVAVRLLDEVDFTSPALYALLLGGAAAFLLLTSAFARGSVTTATAGLVLAETLLPSAVGVVWLGDRPREGMAWLAVLGFAISVGGALALARFGEIPPAPSDSARPDSAPSGSAPSGSPPSGSPPDDGNP
ncbi:hypothetical protein OHA27_21160 [Streptomyces sp. NBC_01619]|uniref:Uncharacterized protein n=2 Tax=Streptomyces TaxID=1883 RepID=A0ACC6QLX2_9ACTN|nr:MULTISPECIES: hypothetical protein [unclassified Streptomyces]MCX4512765.1 hypothetical protein [Streptomyces sp. NBC_01619]